MEDNDIDSLPFQNIDINQKDDQDTLSAEDFAWADSCLVEDPEISETNMDSLKEALLHILDQHVAIHGASADEQGMSELSNDKTDPENLPLVTEESVDQDLKQESYDAVSILKKQPFLPSFNDEMMNMNVHYSDSVDVADAGFAMLMEPPFDEGIFKVWDLDIAVEEDELDKQLKEALSSNGDVTRARKRKGLNMEAVDSLVESIAELSID